MKTIMIGVAALTLLGVSAAALRAQTPAPAPTRTVWDGVFTADQAAAGKTLYDAKCALCHGPDLAGAEMAPPLTGAMFLGNWSGQSAGDLFTRIHTTMPGNDPGSLSSQDTANALAYIFLSNQFPAGKTPLAADDVALGQIAILSEKPAGK